MAGQTHSDSSESEEWEDEIFSSPENDDGKTSWLKRLRGAVSSVRTRKLSVQSGDLIRSNPSSPSGIACTTNSVPLDSVPETLSQARENLSPRTIDSEEDSKRSMYVPRHKSGFYLFFFPLLHKIVKVLFFSPKVGRVYIPVVSILVLFVNMLLIGGMVVTAFTVIPPKINLEVKSFGIPNHPAQIHWDALNAAKHNQFDNSSQHDDSPTDTSFELRKRRSVLQPRSSTGTFPNCPGESSQSRFTSWNMDLVFIVPDSNPNKNILTSKHISRIHEVEEGIYNSQEYGYYCHKNARIRICDPLSSLLTWLYPRDKNTGRYIYQTPDGFTSDLQLSLYNLSMANPIALWFTGGEINLVNSSYEAKLLRTQIQIGLPLPCYLNEDDRRKEQKQRVSDYFISLIPMLENSSTSEVEVLYGGGIVFDYQVHLAILHDAKLAFFSLFLVLVLVFVLSGFSPWLTMSGIYAILTCFAPAYVMYRGVLSIQTLGILNVVSIFVIIGIGVDDVFVFINTFKQSARMKDLHGPYQRLTHTILESSKATFFTSLTTSVAFFANAVSSIPAVRQFGIFMGIVVIFCFLQVLLVIPHSLLIWHCVFVHIENVIYWPVYKLTQIRCRKSTGLSIRMSDIAHGDDDSGIEVSSNSNSDTISNSSESSAQSVSNDSNQSNSNVEVGIDQSDDQVMLIPDQTPESVPSPSLFSPEDSMTAESKLTYAMQISMFYLSVIPMSLHLYFSEILKKNRLKSALFVIFNIFLYVVLVGVFAALMANLRFNDKPPKFFDPDSNIQKMLDLVGNVTDSDNIQTYSFSYWNSDVSVPIVVPTMPSGGSIPVRTVPGGATPPSTTSKSTPFHTATTPTTHRSTTQQTTRPPTTQRLTTRPTTRPTTQPITRPTTHLTTHPTRPPPPNTTPSSMSMTSHQTQPPPTTSGRSTTPTSGFTIPTLPDNQGDGSKKSSRFSGNVPVYVVFGVKNVERHYNPSQVLPEDGNQNYAVLDDSFSNLFTCPIAPGKTVNQVMGAIRGLCRLCTNIANPKNGLTVTGNYQCIPANTTRFWNSYCFKRMLHDMPECSSFLNKDTANVSVAGSAYVNHTNTAEGGYDTLLYLSMAFKSTTNPGNSPFDNVKQYQKWEDFLSSELEAIKSHSSPGQLYEGAEVLLSAFQTSEHWVEVNIEVAAVDGSIYGIFISFMLCSLVVVVLSHDFRIVSAMILTISAILVTLLGMFWAFGWKLGIVEAISLSILVGNSLDYCIHMSEGYVATDARHIAFVDKFKFTKGASLRVKRVMAAISFIGVSILSSAITTILAIIPLLWTQIQLFTRFGEILLIDTAVAILYTLFICSNCLGFFGPPQTEKKRVKILNAVLTIVVTIAVYGVIIVCLFVASKRGVYIPSPRGGELFK